MAVTWKAEFEGQERQFKYDKDRGQYKLWIDDQCYIVKPKLFTFNKVDITFQMDGKYAALELPSGGAMQLFIDGINVQTGKKYIPLPWWYWIFVCAGLFAFVLISGFLGGICAAAIWTGCSALCKSERSTPVRVLGCIGICILSVIAAFVIAFVLY